MIKEITEFFRDRIWRIPLEEHPFRVRALLRPLRVLVMAFQGFNENQIRLRASGLTYYTLLSVVPVLAVAFGIAKGFGLQESLERQIRENVQMQNVELQEEIINRVIDYATRLLAETRGGLVAGVGVIFLFWAVIRLLSNIEFSFNQIWGIKDDRPFGRRLFDFLSLMLVGPILVTSAGALTASLAGYATRLSSRHALLGGFSSVTTTLIPLFMVMVMLFLLYKYMPNTRVSFRAAGLAAMAAAVFYQIAQWIYFNFQVELSNYNAVYGTFAALPLFLIWLHTAWLVILFGAEISFAVENEETYALERKHAVVSERYRQILALRFAEMSVKRFEAGVDPITATGISQQLEVPIRLVRSILNDLVKARVLSVVKDAGAQSEGYQPARATDRLTIVSVLDALESIGSEGDRPLADEDINKIRRHLIRFRHTIEEMPDNVLLSDI